MATTRGQESAAQETSLDWRRQAQKLKECRLAMVKRDINGRGVLDARVLDAMETVPRERFVPFHLVNRAYEDTPLPIGEDQTISQPFIVAVMAEAAQIDEMDRVLEIGTGSGYGAAILGSLSHEVWTIERHRTLARRARATLSSEGFDSVHVVEGDGSAGWPLAAPYDAIVVTAATPEVPEPLLGQLADGGRLVIPVGTEAGGQRLLRFTRDGSEFTELDLGGVLFVPLVHESETHNK